MTKTMVLDEVANSRYNNLNFMRFIAAIMVIICHSIPICYGELEEDFVGGMTNGMLNLGGIAVGVFFVTGGYWIAKSAERKKDTFSFFKARVVRIFPSLWVVVLLSIFVLGPIFTNRTLNEYFHDMGTYKYLLNAVLIPVHSLPGVFESNTYASVVNGPLWTLPLEFGCYIACFCAYKLGFFNGKKFSYTIPFVLVISILFFTICGKNIVLVRIFRPILLYYIGIGYYVFRDKIKINAKYGVMAILLFVLSIVFNKSIVGMLLFFPYMVYFLAYGLPGKLCEFGKKYEISYGMYLYGWPIQQILSGYGGIFARWYVNTIVAMILAIFLGLINHVLVENNKISSFIDKKKG